MKDTGKHALMQAETMSQNIDFLEDEEREFQQKPVAVVEWEDITAYSRVELPEDFEIFRLSKVTVGLLWKEAEDYIVLVQDYDLTNRGKGYRHNDFHIIPRGAIKKVSVLGEVEF
ncbi:MAG: hypothetical protein ACYC1U_10105 [Candidatus Aquicultorales bacterium]